MATLKAVKEIYERTIFQNYLESRRKFAFDYILRTRSERFLSVAIREAVISMSDNNYCTYLLWMTYKSCGVIRICDENLDYKSKLQSVRKMLTKDSHIIIGLIEDENKESMSDKLTDWSQFIAHNIYRTIWPINQNPIDSFYTQLQTKCNSLRNKHVLSEYKVSSVWQQVASSKKSEDIWNNLTNNLNELLS